MPFDDITANRHGGNPYSVAASKQTDRERDALRVYRHVFACGEHGCTADEANTALWGGMNSATASARFSDLKRDEAIVSAGVSRKTRRGCSAEVFVARQFARRT